jgi:heat shock protein HslJ
VSRDRCLIATEPTATARRQPRVVARLIVVAFLLTACAALPAPGSGLDGTEWLSTAVTEDGADRPLVEGTQIRLSFTDGQLGASAGCNTMGGSYRIEDGRLVFEGGAMTEMGCDDERHAQDDWLFGFLGSQPSIAQEGDILTLRANDTVITLQDREVAEPDLPLTGTTWTVDSIISGDAASSVPGNAVATLVFTDDGRVEVATGCNNGSGTYEATDRMLRITGVETTEIGCAGAEGQLDEAVRAVLIAGEVQYAIDAGSLTLMAGDHGLGLRGS